MFLQNGHVGKLYTDNTTKRPEKHKRRRNCLAWRILPKSICSMCKGLSFSDGKSVTSPTKQVYRAESGISQSIWSLMLWH
jgi:hypothetical protein